MASAAEVGKGPDMRAWVTVHPDVEYHDEDQDYFALGSPDIGILKNQNGPGGPSLSETGWT